VQSEMLIPKIVEWFYSTHGHHYGHVPGDLQVHQTQPTCSFRSWQLYGFALLRIYGELTALIKP
jgi:hypothetical protein